MVEPERPQTIWLMRVACFKATRTKARARAPALTRTPTRMYSSTRAYTHRCNRTYCSSPEEGSVGCECGQSIQVAGQAPHIVYQLQGLTLLGYN